MSARSALFRGLPSYYRRLSWVAAIALPVIVAVPAQAGLLYFEGFDSPDVTGTDSAPLTNYGWQAHRGFNGKRAFVTGDAGYWGADPLSASSGTQMRVVDDTAPPPSGTNRVYTFSNSSDVTLSWTEEFAPLTIVDYATLSLSVRSRSGSTASVGLAVRITDGVSNTWYASPLTPGNNSTTVWATLSADVLASVWTQISFDGTQTTDDTSGGFALTGAAGALPIGGLTGAGVFVSYNSIGVSARYDSFQIDGALIPIPEPAAAGVLGLGVVSLLARRRRRA